MSLQGLFICHFRQIAVMSEKTTTAIVTLNKTIKTPIFMVQRLEGFRFPPFQSPQFEDREEVVLFRPLCYEKEYYAQSIPVITRILLLSSREPHVRCVVRNLRISSLWLLFHSTVVNMTCMTSLFSFDSII